MKKSRWLLWFVLVSISITGVILYLIAPATLDDLPHPLNGLMRELHGVSAALAIFMFGYFFANHIQAKLKRYGYASIKQVWDAYIHFMLWLLLILTGLLLYYPYDIGINVVAVHWYLGAMLIVIFPIHFWRKKSNKIRPYKSMKHHR